jgi:NADH-quinone oxidoreductase subunit N
MFINMLNIFSEIYFSFCFLLLLISSIFLNLSKEKNFPNFYKAICFLSILVFINVIIIDLNNCIEWLHSYDLYKTTGDIYIKCIILFFSILFFIYSYIYIKKMKYHLFEYVIIIYFILLSFDFFIISIDLISFYLLLEIQSLSFYILTAFNKHNQYSVESGLKYFILSSFSSVSLLFGYSFLYGLTGTLNILDISLFFSQLGWNTFIIYFIIIVSLLILIAFLFKLYVAPFHLWISDIYQGALTSTTAFFGTITSLPLFYLFIKYFVSFFYFLEYYLFYVFLLLSIVSMLFGAFGALYQKKIKRLIAFSSISNIGYVLVGFLQENPLLLSHSITYFFLYIINVIGIFIIFLNLYLFKDKFFLERLSLLSGVINKNKILSFLLIILFFTSAGIPPFSLFIAKVLLLTGISYNVFSILLFIFVFSTILSSFYYIRVIKTISFDKKKNWHFIMPINYINALLCIYIVLFNIIFVFNTDLIVLFADYITLLLL